MGAAGVIEPSVLNSSALARVPVLPVPPVNRTRPSSSTTAALPLRASVRLFAGVQVPVDTCGNVPWSRNVKDRISSRARAAYFVARIRDPPGQAYLPKNKDT